VLQRSGPLGMLIVSPFHYLCKYGSSIVQGYSMVGTVTYASLCAVSEMTSVCCCQASPFFDADEEAIDAASSHPSPVHSRTSLAASLTVPLVLRSGGTICKRCPMLVFTAKQTQSTTGTTSRSVYRLKSLQLQYSLHTGTRIHNISPSILPSS
jgi:hypothetical protein